MYMEVSDGDTHEHLEDNVYHEIDDVDHDWPGSSPQVVGIFRINSKTV